MCQMLEEMRNETACRGAAPAHSGAPPPAPGGPGGRSGQSPAAVQIPNGFHPWRLMAPSYVYCGLRRIRSRTVEIVMFTKIFVLFPYYISPWTSYHMQLGNATALLLPG